MVQRHLMSMSLALGRERPRRHALPGFPAPSREHQWSRGFSHPHLPAHRPSWGRGGHRGSQPEPKKGESKGFFAVQESPLPTYLKMKRSLENSKLRLAKQISG